MRNIDVQQGLLSFEGATTSLGDPTAALTVEAGATLAFLASSNQWSKVFDLNGDGLTTTVSNAGGSNTMNGSLTINGACIFAVAGSELTLGGPISGSGGLTKTLGGILYLNGPDTLAGTTQITGGTLAIGNSGSLTNCTSLVIAAGALLDVSGMSGGGMTLAGGQMLSGDGSVKGNFTVGSGATLFPGGTSNLLTFSNSLTLAGGSRCLMEASKTPSNNSRVYVSGTLTFGGTLVVSNAGTVALAGGDSFNLFTAGSYAGSFSAILPTVPGPGLIWDTSHLGTTGTLGVIAGTLPVFKSIGLNGSNLVMGGVGGTVNGRYYVLTSTNLALPLAQWLVVATNQMNSNGVFLFTNALQPGVPRMFYSLRMSNSAVGVGPSLGAPVLLPGGLLLSGSGGPAYGTYYVLASTNPALPFARWPVIATNQTDSNGVFLFTNPFSPGAPMMFYRLRVP